MLDHEEQQKADCFTILLYHECTMYEILIISKCTIIKMSIFLISFSQINNSEENIKCFSNVEWTWRLDDIHFL